MPRVLLARKFTKNFKQLDSKIQTRIKAAVLSLGDDPAQGKRLTGELSDEYSLRVGSYRILYTFQDDSVIVETVRHRKDVYKRK